MINMPICNVGHISVLSQVVFECFFGFILFDFNCAQSDCKNGTHCAQLGCSRIDKGIL